MEVLGQVVDVDHRPWREYQEPLDRIRQLADIPGPCVTLEDPHRLWSDFLLAQPTALLQRQEVRDDARDIVRTFTQRRHRDANDVDPVQEVLPQPTSSHELVDITVRGHDHADIDGDRSNSAHPAQLPVIEHFQELRLHLR